jgi:hypothetical protein
VGNNEPSRPTFKIKTKRSASREYEHAIRNRSIEIDDLNDIPNADRSSNSIGRKQMSSTYS